MTRETRETLAASLTVGAFVALARVKRGLTQEQAAELLGWTVRTLGSTEQDARRLTLRDAHALSVVRSWPTLPATLLPKRTTPPSRGSPAIGGSPARFPR